MDPVYQQGARAFFKSSETVRLFGVRTPQVKQIEKELFQSIRHDWTVKEAIAFCDILIQYPELDARLVGILLLGRFKKQYEPALLAQIETWLKKGYCDNWATTDALCGCVAGYLLVRQPQLIAQMKKWTQAKHLYIRRAAAVSMLPVIRTNAHLDEAYVIAESLFDQPEDLIHKATGWLLRELGKKDLHRLESFLLAHGPRIPRTALRYAIERFPEAQRKNLLTQTRKFQSGQSMSKAESSLPNETRRIADCYAANTSRRMFRSKSNS